MVFHLLSCRCRSPIVLLWFHDRVYNEMTTRKIKIGTNTDRGRIIEVGNGSCLLTSERSDDDEAAKYIVKRSFWP